MDSGTAVRTRSRRGPSCAFVQFEEIFRYKAHTIHVLAMCDALTTLGVDTTLFMQAADGAGVPSSADLRQRYGLDHTPQISWIRNDANRWVARFRVLVESARAGRHSTFAYTTRALPALGALLGGARLVVLETHSPSAFWSRHDRVAFRLVRHSRRLRFVFVSRRLAGIVARQCGLEETALIVEQNGHTFPIRDDYRVESAAGRRLRAMYTGTFQPGKGVQTIFALAELHPAVDFILVGGQAPSGKLPDNISVRAEVPHADIPELLSQSDVLLMPVTVCTGEAILPDEKGDAEEFYSPLKMVEYLSAGRSIIASNLPSIAEVLEHDSNCLLVDPGSVQEWSAALGRLEHDAGLRVRLSHGAAETARQHTLQGRVRRILEHTGALV